MRCEHPSTSSHKPILSSRQNLSNIPSTLHNHRKGPGGEFRTVAHHSPNLAVVRLDNGPEMTLRAINLWVRRVVGRVFIPPDDT